MELVIAFLVKHLWAILLALVGFIVWLTRLEWLVRTNMSKIEKLERNADQDRRDVNANISSLRSEMSIKFGEIQKSLQDIAYRLGSKADR